MRKIFFVAIVFLYSSLCFAQKTNVDIFSELIKDVLTNNLEKIAFDKKAVFVIQSNKNDDFNRFLENEFVQWAVINGHDTFNNQIAGPVSSEMKTYFIEFTPVRYSVNYDIKNEKNGNVSRHISVQLIIKILDGTNKVLLNKNFQKHYNDTVQKDQLDNLEQDLFDFTNADRKQNLINRLFEPVLVSVATGSIIYLFYIFRSN